MSISYCELQNWIMVVSTVSVRKVKQNFTHILSVDFMFTTNKNVEVIVLQFQQHILNAILLCILLGISVGFK